MSKSAIKTKSFKIVISEINRMLERQNTNDLILIKRIAVMIANQHSNTMKSNKKFPCNTCNNTHKSKSASVSCCSKKKEVKEKFNRNKIKNESRANTF